MANIVLPELAEGINQATITYWHLGEGEKVTEGQDIVEMATDKATFNLPSPSAGVLSKKLREEGETVNVGETLGIIEEG
jgi:2-oxoglutarate dehydrogenase E2 component (dihydrolipoamide succinyltransferase)